YNGETELVFPKREAWLGSTSGKVISEMAPGNVVSRRVPLRKIDDFVAGMPTGPILMKVDVEGSEPEVFAGALGLIRDRSPAIIFESNDPDLRPPVFKFLNEREYHVYCLPW